MSEDPDIEAIQRAAASLREAGDDLARVQAVQPRRDTRMTARLGGLGVGVALAVAVWFATGSTPLAAGLGLGATFIASLVLAGR